MNVSSVILSLSVFVLLPSVVVLCVKAMQSNTSYFLLDLMQCFQ